MKCKIHASVEIRAEPPSLLARSHSSPVTVGGETISPSQLVHLYGASNAYLGGGSTNNKSDI